MIKFHPSDITLGSFVQGFLPSASSLMVSAHCDMCPSCCEKTYQFTQSTAHSIFDDELHNVIQARDYVCMFDFITRDTTLVSTNIKSMNKHTIKIDGRTFSLPSTLIRFSDRIGTWTNLVGKLWYAPIDIGGNVMAQLIYMEQGGLVPEHTHKGNEITLVIAGQFDDGKNMCSAGDYMALNQSHTHMPKTDAKEGCLVLSVLDKPLHFTAGWAKLINPLSHLYFKTHNI